MKVLFLAIDSDTPIDVGSIIQTAMASLPSAVVTKPPPTPIAALPALSVNGMNGSLPAAPSPNGHAKKRSSNGRQPRRSPEEIRSAIAKLLLRGPQRRKAIMDALSLSGGPVDRALASAQFRRNDNSEFELTSAGRDLAAHCG